MLSWFSSRWVRHPLVILGGLFLIALAIDSISAVWGEKRPVGGFFEEFVARMIHWGTPLGSFAIAIWFGIKISERSKSKLLGWIAGILLFALVGFGAIALSSKISGVGWRIDRLMTDRD